MIKIVNDGAEVRASCQAQGNGEIRETVSEIIRNVRARGDEALLSYEERFSNWKRDAHTLELPPEEWERGAEVDAELLGILERAAENIRRFHSHQVRSGFVLMDKLVTGQRVIPLDRVGIYVPGGTAAYPSTVLMNAIPAKIAGCGEIIMTTPPRKDGSLSPMILAAAKIAGVDRVFRMGGAQAVAALAYGTESVPRVDKIVGPGNAWVAEAKRQVFGDVGIDMVAGPSEILIIADGDNRPDWLAADMLAQAEHDRMARAVLLTTSPELARAVAEEIEKQIPLLERAEIARASIEENGRIVLTENLAQAMELANTIAPEHLELCVKEPFAWLGQARHAGSVFLGQHSPEALGDYCAGPNHTLPTSGTARFSSPLSVDDFVRTSQFIYAPRGAMPAADVAALARQEGLTAHARSAEIRN